MLLGWFQKRVQHLEDAEDLRSLLFERIAKNLAQLKDEERLVPWVFTLARRTLADFYRSQHQVNSKRYHTADAPEEIPDIHQESARIKADLSDLSDCLRPFMKTLGPEDQAALEEVEIRGQSITSWASSSNISISAAKSRVLRARQRLKTQLQACCEFITDPYGSVYDYEPHKTNPSHNTNTKCLANSCTSTCDERETVPLGTAHRG